MQPITEPCRWNILVRNAKRPQLHSLSVYDEEKFTKREVSFLQRLEGCKSLSTCGNGTVPCTYGIEDPSDALWLRDYQQFSKFVVIFRIGLATLLFFLVSVIVDGSIFYPHRTAGFSTSSASMMAIIAFASLLYVLVVPRQLQFCLYGAGTWQSIGYIFTILMIAGALPGVVVAWVSFCLFFIYFLSFLMEQIVCMLTGILHYLGALTLYQAENTLIHLNRMYNRDFDRQVDLDRRLLEISERFLRRVRGNAFLYRVPTALEQDGIQVVESTIPDHLFDELFQENILEIDFENIEGSNEDTSTPQSTEETPLLQSTATTPLLQQSSPT